jgi:hypothetical protein
MGWDFVCLCNCASHLATLLLMLVLNIQGHNLFLSGSGLFWQPAK